MSDIDKVQQYEKWIWCSKGNSRPASRRRTLTVAVAESLHFLSACARMKRRPALLVEDGTRSGIGGFEMRKICEVRKIYDWLCLRFGKVGIDAILYPCWDESLVSYDLGWRVLDETPYEFFVDNLEYFLEVLRERGKLDEGDEPWLVSGNVLVAG